MNQNKYLREVSRHLKCSNKSKKKICNDLKAEIYASLAANEGLEEILDRMGNPGQIAMEFNENFSEQEIRLAKTHKRIKIVGIIVIVIAALVVAGIIALPRYYSMGTTGKYSEQTVKQTTEKVIDMINHNQYQVLLDNYSAPVLKKAVTEDQLIEAKNKVGANWDSYEKVTSWNMNELKYLGKTYACVECVALYDNRSVTYTFSYDDQMKLSAIYMK
jgi:hypothetical protein